MTSQRPVAGERAAPGRTLLRGVPVVPGAAYGAVVLARSEVDPAAVERFRRVRLGERDGLARYDAAVSVVAGRLLARAARTEGAAAEVLAATAALVRDPALRSAVAGRLATGDLAGDLVGALAAGVDELARSFAGAGGVTAERVSDLGDLAQRLTAEIVGAPEPGIILPDEPGVLVAEDLAPVDTVGLDADRVLALVTERGGPTSHTAVIARQLGIPLVVRAAGVCSIPAGTMVLVDGVTGEVAVRPPADSVRRVVDDAATRRTVLERWAGPGRTADGVAVPVLANVTDVASATAAARGPVEGCGLFRTELCFLNRGDEPSVSEQADLYGQVLSGFGPRRTVVVRTFDVAADKPLPFATPAAGERRPRGVLERQLDAVAQAAGRTGTKPWVMAPMVATVDEAREFARLARARGLPPGVMVEVPSAALLADRLLEHVDFLSVGTNDLTRSLVADRRAEADAPQLDDPWQPAVLRLVAMTAEAGRRAGKPVGVCGEAAADPLLATVLVGLGVTSLSLAVAAVPAVGVQLAAVTTADCRAAADAALAAADPAAGRTAVLRLLSS